MKPLVELPILDFGATVDALPDLPADAEVARAVNQSLKDTYDVVIVLDDDPTGTQTVHGVPVIAELTESAIRKEFLLGTPLFFLLTNSRALTPKAAGQLAHDLGSIIARLSTELGIRFITLIRGDSTLRGHFPLEDQQLAKGLGIKEIVHYVIPAFFEGGRYTISDIHYVKEGEKLVPAGQTPFSKDTTFGYRSSKLQEWVSEKSAGLSATTAPASLSLKDLRAERPTQLREVITGLKPGQTCIVNAADYIDLKRAALAILRFSNPAILRVSASFVKALLGQPEQGLLQLPREEGGGGLVLVGSHVPKTTAQLSHLQKSFGGLAIEIDVEALLQDNFHPPELIANQVDQALKAGKDVLVFTSRKVIKQGTGNGNLSIANKVSTFCQSIVANLRVQPAFLVTKGGITSSDIATKALGIRRAIVLGQVLPGVPTWELGPETRFPGMPFVIFPGNVGEEGSLSLILKNTRT